MAKVTGPLYSMSASGKLGNALVFFGWKGLNVVREWVIPANPRTALQNIVRFLFGVIGRAASFVRTETFYERNATAAAPSGQTWISALVGRILRVIIPDRATFESVRTNYLALTTVSTWQTSATDIGITSFTSVHAPEMGTATAGLQLYLLALYAVSVHDAGLGIFNKPYYAVSPATWTVANIESFEADIIAAIV